MADALTLYDTRYSLAEAAILSQPWLSASTLPDALARPSVVTATVEQPLAMPRRIVIRKRGPTGPAEIQASGSWPRTFLKSAGAVVELLNLPAGWNSYAAKPITPQNALEAIRLLAAFVGPETPQPAVVPRVQGGIQLEWHTASVDIEVYIDAPGRVRFFVEGIEAGETFDGPLAGNEPVLKAWVQHISGK
jgi:hypothetical protein